LGLLRGVHAWLGPWLRDRVREAARARVRGDRHVLLVVCDHFEPLHGGARAATGIARVGAWREGLPALAARFRDADGRPPRHTFFFPGEEYDARLVEPLAEMTAVGLAEVEVHLHHDGDTRASLARRLERTLERLEDHGLVGRRAGRRAWAFIHGNWALANGRPDGRWCGVDDELSLLRELGCYADFTFPSAPDPCQPRVVNAIYYARDERRRRAYDEALRPPVAGRRPEGVLLVQGPLAIARRPRSARPRIDAGALSASDPPSRARLRTWLRQHVHVPGRPEWTFVKLCAHGAPERNARVMLGAAMAGLHEALAELAASGAFRLHYVTAREAYNVASAAMDGLGGTPSDHLDYEVAPCRRALTRSAPSSGRSAAAHAR
jgi:hypothetical protein